MTKNLVNKAFLLLLTAIALYFCYLLLVPFQKPIICACIITILFYPLHVYVHRKVRNSVVAAGLSTIVVIGLIATGSIVLMRALMMGLVDIYQSLGGSQGGNEKLSLYILHLIERTIDLAAGYLPISTADLRSTIVSQSEKAVAALLQVTAGAVGGFATLVWNWSIVFFTLFFLFRDGRSMLRRIVVLVPLSTPIARKLFVCTKETLNAIVYGTMAMAGIQGALTGIAFWFLGLSSPGLWAIVTALCALLPVVGTTFVLLPAGCMLLFSGHWIKALILLTWGVAVVHPVDNLLRPYLIGGRAKLSTLYVFFAVIGGLKTFGALGLLVGPLLLAITKTLLIFLRDEKFEGTWDWQINSRAEVGVTSPQALK